MLSRAVVAFQAYLRRGHKLAASAQYLIVRIPVRYCLRLCPASATQSGPRDRLACSAIDSGERRADHGQPRSRARWPIKPGVDSDRSQPLEWRLSGSFIIAMQGQFELSFGLQYSPVWCRYAAHVMAMRSRRELPSLSSTSPLQFCQFCRLGIVGSQYL